MKRYTEGERRALLAELESSGKSLREFCTERGLNVRTVQRWQREARQNAEHHGPGERPGFLPVQIAGQPSPLRSSEGALWSWSSPGIERKGPFPRLIIQGETGWVLEWQGPVEQGALEAALRAVVGVCGQR